MVKTALMMIAASADSGMNANTRCSANIATKTVTEVAMPASGDVQPLA